MWRHLLSAALLLAISLACAQPATQAPTSTTTGGVTVTTLPGAAPVITADPQPQRPTAPMTSPSVPLPAEVGGFRFGAPIAEVQAACVAGGHAWDTSGVSPVCEGTRAESGCDA